MTDLKLVGPLGARRYVRTILRILTIFTMVAYSE